MKTQKPPRRAPGSDPSPPNVGARYAITDDRPRRVAEPPPAYGNGPSTSVVSATEAARRFSDLINRACFQEETFVIERGGRPICQLGPLQGRSCSGAALLALLTRLPRPDEDFLAAVESVQRAQAVVEGSPWEK
jgi:antitoxin (DNA-binding transcriptional repressor) of toxin-antitoxin stability system